jgi:type I restriction enzyme S subunit
MHLDWRSVRLGELCRVQNGFPFKSEFFQQEKGVPLVRVRSLKTQSCDVKYSGKFDTAFLAKDGDILIGMDGDFQPCYWNGGTALLNQRVCRLVEFSDQVDPYFVYEALKGPLKKIEETTHYTTVKHISSYTIQEIELSIPPLPEQQLIARVLRVVQEAKAARQRELALERERKAALMEYLFTHGTRGEPTKRTEIGETPENWQVAPLGAIAELVSGGTPSRENADWWNGAIPWASPKDMKRVLLTDTEEHISKQALEAGARLVPSQAIFIVIRGMILAKDVPIALTAVPMAFNQDMKAVLPHDGQCPEFLLYAVIFRKTALVRHIGTSAHGTRRLSTAAVDSLPLPIPPIGEQIEIVRLLGSCEKKIDALEREIPLQEELFVTMLEELMTGRLSAVSLIQEHQAR